MLEMATLEDRCLACNKSNEELKKEKNHLKTCSRCLIAMFCSVSCQKAILGHHNIACKKVTKATKMIEDGEKFIIDTFGPKSRICWTDTSILDKAGLCVQLTGDISFFKGLQGFTDGKLEFILRMFDIAIVNRSPKGLEKVLDEALEALKMVQPNLQELRYLIPILMLELGKIDDAYNHTKFWISNIHYRRTSGTVLVKSDTIKEENKEENLLKVVENDFDKRLKIADVFHLVHLALIKYKIGQDELAEECLGIIQKHCHGLIWIFLSPTEEGKEVAIPKDKKVKGAKPTFDPKVLFPGVDPDKDSAERSFCEWVLRLYGPSINNYLDHHTDIKKRFEDFMIKSGCPKKRNNYGWVQKKSQ